MSSKLENGKEESYVRVSQDHLLVQWFTRRAHRTQYIVRFTAIIYYSKSIQSEISKRNSAWGHAWGTAHTNLWESFPREATQVVLNFPSDELWPHMGNNIHKEAIRHSVHKTFPGAGPVGTLSPACTKTADLQKVKRGHNGEAQCNGSTVLIRRGRDTRVHVRRGKAMWGHSEKMLLMTHQGFVIFFFVYELFTFLRTLWVVILSGLGWSWVPP